MVLLSSHTSELFVCHDKLPGFSITEQRRLHSNVMVSLALISFLDGVFSVMT